MKKILLFLAVIAFGSSVYAQELALTIPDLDNAEKPTKLLLLHAELTQPNVYLVKRKKDGLSKKLEAAAKSKKEFSSAFIFLKLNNGGSTVNQLSNVFLSDYSNSISNNSNTEEFTVTFEDSIPTH